MGHGAERERERAPSLPPSLIIRRELLGSIAPASPTQVGRRLS